jgi:hypothetical protein
MGRRRDATVRARTVLLLGSPIVPERGGCAAVWLGTVYSTVRDGTAEALMDRAGRARLEGFHLRFCVTQLRHVRARHDRSPRKNLSWACRRRRAPTLDPADPRLVDLANESEALAAKLAVKAKAETALVEEADKRGRRRPAAHRSPTRRLPRLRSSARVRDATPSVSRVRTLPR